MQRVFGDLDALRYVDGHLDADRRAAFLAHLADNPGESERVAMWERQNEVLRAAFASVAIESIPPALRLGNMPPARSAAVLPVTPLILRPIPGRAKLPLAAAEPTISAAVVDPPPRRRDLRLPLSVAVLCGLAMLILYVAHGLLATSSTWLEGGAAARMAVPVPALSARAADAYVTFALDPIRPVEFTAAQSASLSQWIRRRVGLTITPADLAPEGWTLLGGRLVPAPEKPAAFFVYEDRGGGRLGLLVADASSGTLPATMSLAPVEAAVATVSWTSGPFTYVLATDRSADWLSRNTEALRERVALAAER